MLERRAPRFAVEVLVLVALAVSLTIAHLNRLVIAGVMLLGWLIVSVLEWASLRGEAHYGSGLPPRYYVPQVLLPPPLTLEESVERYPSAPPVEEPAWVVSPAFGEEAVVGGWPLTAPAPEQEAASLEPAAFVGGTEQAWEPVQPAADDVAAQIEPGWTPELEPPEELEPEWEPSVETTPELEPEEAADATELRPAVSDVSEYEALPAEEAADQSWLVEGLPGVPTAEEELLEFVPEPEAELAAPAPEELEPVAEFELAEPEVEEEPVAEVSEPPPAISAGWFDAQLPGASVPLEPEPEPEFELELVEEPVLELPEPVVEEPVAELELPQPELEEEPVLELLPELPISASWFDAQLPGVSVPLEPEPDFELELVEEPVLELPEPVVEEPVAELELPEPELEQEPEIDLELLAGEPLPEEPELVSWFDAQLPGASVAEPEPADEVELPAWALVDSESDWEREDEAAAQESLAEELEPLLELEYAPEQEVEPEQDFEVPVGEPLPEEPALASWFDAQLPGVLVSEQGSIESEWLPEPDPSELQAKTAAEIAAEEFLAEEPPSAPVFGLEPVAEYEFPASELELDILVERLAGEPLGKDASLVSWFDAQLPGAMVVSAAESSSDEALVGRAQHLEHGVGGWVAGHVPEGWRVSESSAAGASGDERDVVLDEVWERDVVAEEDSALMEVAPQEADVTARHSIDPLVGVAPSRSRLWGRQHAADEAEDAVTVEVPARPVGRRLLPGHSKREN